ncbi:phosphatase PAP2 family protein [Ramlibacter tataouinensis]|uniref:phosphatase PAP2 family protein n=1 Tax=Ramlibacter tataouinensis TaxID=94132 RepID=UPI0022F3D2BA|nr:phosphatase PAP2 family protein [Ramlibacter tataouinensis]WBY01651.1 phosphatase PAP2 family protein [Ramlibacter tataouinensis]
MFLRSPFRRLPESLAVLAGLLLLMAWDASTADALLARWMGGPSGFALRNHWLLEGVLHQGARALAWGLVVWLAVGLRWPLGVLRALAPARRAWLLAATLGGMLLVSALKQGSLSSCPWDLQEFGGMARHVSHWAWLQADGGPGHCFPAGHASAGFAWVAGWFAFRDWRPGVARGWLVAALVAGAAIGLAQQLRGAHFASHTLWTAWICWTWAWAFSAALPPQEDDAPAAG